MDKKLKLTPIVPGETRHGFKLIKKEFVESKNAELYTLSHLKTGTELLYFDRDDENKTFSIAFTTLPEDNTGVFHILEHSVLNGSKKYPVKEPFVSLLQSSMQTFLNAMTFSDKTLYPVSSRNEQDLFNLMSVYLDGVFNPLIYTRPEIFMQEGWHYEFEDEGKMPYYNGVVYSEMKGVYSDVDSLIMDETQRLLFPDNSYGYISGGHPENITDLTYEKFIDTHKRFYHPSNAKIFLDGHMDIDTVLEYIDGEYLSKYDYRKPDFAFKAQTPRSAQSTLYYEAQPDDNGLSHMVFAKILCMHDDIEKIYAAKILADYLTGSNEAPLKRAFLESGLCQDVTLEVADDEFQPFTALVIRNADKNRFDEIKAFIKNAFKDIAKKGIDGNALKASIERFAFKNKEISEPYGLELAIRALNGWLYGDDPLTHIDNAAVFDALREKSDTAYFTDLMLDIFTNDEGASYLYILPSLTKGEDDAKKEALKLENSVSKWTEDDKKRIFDEFTKMVEWQRSMDTDEALSTLPHLKLSDIPESVEPIRTELENIENTQVLHVDTQTNGIVYLNMYFDISDFTTDELCEINVLSSCFGELSTKNYPADKLQSAIKGTFGSLYASLKLFSKPAALDSCTPYLHVSASMLEENAQKAACLIRELLLNGRYDETDRIAETVLQNEYFLKQSLISNGHMYAITKALSAFSAEGALSELTSGESFVRWYGDYAEGFNDNAQNCGERLASLAKKAFSKNRLFVGVSGNIDSQILSDIISALPKGEIGKKAEHPKFDTSNAAITIPSDVSYSAIGGNLYAAGGKFTGSCSVAASLITYGYLWNMVRVRGGAYGTGMNVRTNGDIFCYSYRDPNVKNSRDAFYGAADFLEDALGQGMPIDDIIIGTVNTTDPLLSPSNVCKVMCERFIKGTTDRIAEIRREILKTTPNELLALKDIIAKSISDGKFCAVGGKDAVAFLEK